MSSHSRKYSGHNDWNPMQEDFENSNYDMQNPDESSSDFPKLDPCRLYVRNVPIGLSEDGLRSAFAKYGNIIEAFVSSNPQKRYALISYETPAEAKNAMMKLNNVKPLELRVNIAHENKNARNNQSTSNNSRSQTSQENRERRDTPSNSRSQTSHGRDRSNTGSQDYDNTYSSRKSRKAEDLINGDSDPKMGTQDELSLGEPDLQLELEKLKLESLRLQREELECKKRMLIKQAEHSTMVSNQSSNRCVLPNGRVVVVKNVTDGIERRDGENNLSTGAGDSNQRERTPVPPCWDQLSTDGSSTQRYCNQTFQNCKNAEQCLEIYTKNNYSDKSGGNKESSHSKSTKKSEVDRKQSKTKSTATCDLKYSDFYTDDDEIDETNKLIELRNSDYANVVDESLKIVVAQAGYPKLKMHLRQMAAFQRSLAEVTEMQSKAGLLKRSPSFLDYYLNKGAIVCICRDVETRDWVVRITPGLQERMSTSLILLKAKVKRICLAVLKIPQPCWPATAYETFKLLYYFNPSLKTDSWKIYSQKTVNDVETTFFMIDRVSSEIIRGPSFNNIIEYSQMDLDLKGYTEIYYECLVSDLKEDLSSVASRVKLLEEIKSEPVTPRDVIGVTVVPHSARTMSITPRLHHETKNVSKDEARPQSLINLQKTQFESGLHKNILKKLKDVQYIGEKDEMIAWSDRSNCSDQENEKDDAKQEQEQYEDQYDEKEPFASTAAISEKTESIIESNDNLNLSRNLYIDSNRGIAYHRRTNYLHVEPELKIAITLDGYPQDKLEGSHIRRLKHLFKEYLHKDMKNQRFTNMIIPKFQDIYLSNGAVIYICDSLETKDYLTEILPKIINATGLKLTFRDVKDLVRYTRIVMRLPKEQAHVESLEILMKLQATYPGLKLNCWKYYSDVAGKQKRQFGVDPESLQVIKSPDFNPTYEGEKISFRIIDRQKRDVRIDELLLQDLQDQSSEDKKLREIIANIMYVPVNPEITNSPLTRIRTNHYSDLIADDLKLYVGPASYPESRVDDSLFHAIKRTLETIILEALDSGDLTEDRIPQLHDMYLFDGVIFIICVNKESRFWIEENMDNVNAKLRSNLKCTEFRGAVGIISMCIKTDKDTDSVFKILQKQNPRLRTKYWRTISTVRTKTKIDVVLQIDKLSAQVMTSPGFNKIIDGNPIKFELGHLQSLLKKASLELNKAHTKGHEKKTAVMLHRTRSEVAMRGPKDKNFEELMNEICKERPALKADDWSLISLRQKDNHQVCNLEINELSAKIIEKEDFKLSVGNDKLFFYTEPPSSRSAKESPMVAQDWPKGVLKEVMTSDSNQDLRKMILKMPMDILPDNKEDLNIIFDLLEDKNPGLNTELWKVYTEGPYPNNGKFTLLIDRQSASVIEGKNFDPTVGGQKLKFYF